MIIISVEESDIQNRAGQGAYAIACAVHRRVQRFVKVVVYEDTIQFRKSDDGAELNMSIDMPEVVHDFVMGKHRPRRPFKFAPAVPTQFLPE